MLDLVHRLADAHRGRLVEHDLDAVERLRHGLPVADVAHEQLGLRVEVRGTLRARAVHLRIQVVEHAHAMARRDEGVHEVRADEAGAAGHQDPHAAILPT